MSGLFQYVRASRRRSARAAEARRLSINYVLRTVKYILILRMFLEFWLSIVGYIFIGVTCLLP